MAADLSLYLISTAITRNKIIALVVVLVVIAVVGALIWRNRASRSA
ncbi:MAG TPA: hypothetical protein VFD49_22485 [Candidatus Dormibacteraeota bacterium]|nr:hypothetical protein [Candidatus Dormibacteraeota bacterium]